MTKTQLAATITAAGAAPADFDLVEVTARINAHTSGAAAEIAEGADPADYALTDEDVLEWLDEAATSDSVPALSAAYRGE